jgi:UDP-N-acetylglucosamine 2-epimerase (non-hydrolysing)
MKAAVVLGTRPEIIKMAPVVRELQRQENDFFILHTGQHYSYDLDRVFFEQLSLPEAQYNLEVGSGSQAEQTAKILIGTEKVLLTEKPDIVLVEGDTNSVLGAALAAVKMHIRVGHVEAGLRSYDRRMPEEINRILTDHCSDLLFAPTSKARATLLGEGIPKGRIFVTGNTIVDAVHQNLTIAKEKATVLSTLGLKRKGYFLVTLHRQENVDDRKRFAAILEGLSRVATEFRMPILYSIHPRSRKMMTHFKLEPRGLEMVEPVDFLNFLQLENSARLILSDSGGVQEEACILGVPCVTLRDNTERPETLEVGANILAGTSPDNIVASAGYMLSKKEGWANPFGDGTAGKKIVATTMRR